MNTDCAPPLRCTLVWLATTAAAVLAGVALRADAVALAGGPGTDLATALVRAGSVILLACAGWAWLVTTTVVLEVARGRVGLTRAVPASWRRAVLLACGASLAAGLAGPAAADPGLAGLPLPDRALGGPAPAVVVPLPAAVTVRPGDTLWALAERELGPTASPAQVDRRWRELYRLNRSVVGPDPDLIRPGQRLRLPPSPQEPS